MADARKLGWRISDVERLTGLSRRDIQRCCYDGKGGIGLLSPKDSSWGKRVYGMEDLATLWVVAAYRRKGFTLPQIKEVFDKNQGKPGLKALLDEQQERLQDQLDLLSEQYVGTRAIRATLEDDSSERLGKLMHDLSATYFAIHPDEQTADDLLSRPGMELLMELWLGPDGIEATS